MLRSLQAQKIVSFKAGKDKISWVVFPVGGFLLVISRMMSGLSQRFSSWALAFLMQVLIHLFFPRMDQAVKEDEIALVGEYIAPDVNEKVTGNITF